MKTDRLSVHRKSSKSFTLMTYINSTNVSITADENKLGFRDFTHYCQRYWVNKKTYTLWPRFTTLWQREPFIFANEFNIGLLLICSFFPFASNGIFFCSGQMQQYLLIQAPFSAQTDTVSVKQISGRRQVMKLVILWSFCFTDPVFISQIKFRHTRRIRVLKCIRSVTVEILFGHVLL